jgi:formylglycine-generating enzyme required for sulfatase activity
MDVMLSPVMFIGQSTNNNHICPSALLVIIQVILLLLLSATLSTTFASSKASSLPIFHDCKDCPEMVALPAGEYMMGITKEDAVKDGLPSFYDDIPYHHVVVQAFAIARYDVTKAEYATFIKETRYSPSGGCKITIKNSDGYSSSVVPSANWKNTGFTQTDRDPVVCVSWDDAQRYVEWLNTKVGLTIAHANNPKGIYRLPSEEQWEYAARAGTTTIRYWGDSVDAQCEYANGQDMTSDKKYSTPGVADFEPPAHCSDGFVDSSPVGSFKPNAWGLYDMLGNVNQWIEEPDDIFSPRSFMPSASKLQWRKVHRIYRGGSFNTLPWALITAIRNVAHVDMRQEDIGFRLVRDMQ